MDELTKKRLSRQYGAEIALLKQSGEHGKYSEEDMNGGLALKAACDKVMQAFETYVEQTGDDQSNVVSFCCAMGVLINGLISKVEPHKQNTAKQLINSIINGLTIDEIFKTGENDGKD